MVIPMLAHNAILLLFLISSWGEKNYRVVIMPCYHIFEAICNAIRVKKVLKFILCSLAATVLVLVYLFAAYHDRECKCKRAALANGTFS